MRICLVTAFPPSKRGLNEYGYHIARELSQDPLLSLSILGDVLEDGSPAPSENGAEDAAFDVHRVWCFNELDNPLRLLRKIRELKPDVVWFNLLFSTFGSAPLPAFIGLLTPLLTRLNGIYSHVTLHHLMDNINLKDSGVRFPWLYRIGGYIATRLLLMANSVSVLLPAYRRTLMQKYNGDNVHWRAHGILSARPEFPDFNERGNPEHRILAFGKWGTYKRLELLIESFTAVMAVIPNVKLVVAGGNHPAARGYVESIAERFRDCRSLEFTGYVPEESIPELFRSASMVVMPYNSATGASGVAHLACEYGCPIVSADIPDFREMAADENLAIDFYETGNSANFANTIIALLRSPERMRAMAEQNFSAALRMTMPQIIRKYLRSFELHKDTKSLQPLARFRRLPIWVPSRSALFRAAAPRWQAWM